MYIWIAIAALTVWAAYLTYKVIRLSRQKPQDYPIWSQAGEPIVVLPAKRDRELTSR